MIFALVTGTLVGAPMERRATNGNAYATCSVRVPVDRSEGAFVSVIAFDDDVRAALAELRKGDAISVSGRLKPSAWTGSDGVERSGLSLVAQQIAAGRPPKNAGRRRQPARQLPGGESGTGFPEGADDLSMLDG